MVEFFRAGGFVMIFVLGFGALAVAAAVHFARSPDERRLGLVRSLSATTLFSMLAGLITDVAAVLHNVPRHPEWLEGSSLPMVVMTGLAEALTPGILGFTLLALAQLVTAVGMRRLPDPQGT